jgi:hypothetical protein
MALGDSANVPRYIETLRHRGYRFLLPTQTDDVPRGPLPGSAAEERGAPPWFHRLHLSIGLTAATALALILVVWSGRASESTRSHRVATAQGAPDHPRNVEAWVAYQKGQYLWKTRTAAAVEKSPMQAWPMPMRF